jgi:hypothetical protein
MVSTVDDVKMVPAHESLRVRGILALQVYQRQQEIANRLWSYFSQYTFLIISISVIVVAFRRHPDVSTVPAWVVAVPLLAYVFFLVGNHSTLRRVLKELAQFQAVAVATTRLTLETPKQGLTLAFHIVLAAASVAIYALSWASVSEVVPGLP